MSVTWVGTSDVAEAIGTVTDAAWLASCTEAANAWAFRRRMAAGYADDPAQVPGPDVALGVVLFAKSLYMQRAAVDGYQSFQQLEGFVPTGSMGEIRMLLGVNRPQVG